MDVCIATETKEEPMNRHISLRALAVIVPLLAGMAAAETPNRVTILYDSFGKSPSLTMDWGFAALVEYGGKRILFDTGNNASIFEHNVKALGVDLQKIDFVVTSHRHADHTSGITYLLTVNPKVKIYVPDEPWGLFARGVKSDIYRKDPSLPADMRYYGGHPPEMFEGGTPWPGGNFIPISQRTEMAHGIFVIPGVSTSPGTLELKELSQSHRHEISRRNEKRNLRRSVPISGFDSVARQHVKVSINHAVRYGINGPPAHVPRL